MLGQDKYTPGPWAQYTPGPWSWTYSDATCSRPIALDAPGGDVMTASEDEDGPRAYVSLANAALMAAAPDLLEACKAALPGLEDAIAADCPWCGGEGGWTNDDPLRMVAVRHKGGCPVLLARTAIAKAEGR